MSTSTSAPRDPEEATAGGLATAAAIPAATTLGAVHLSVADLERSLAYYTTAIGLQVLDQGADRAVLGTDTPLLALVEQRGALPADGFAGLYHVALLLPERVDLARWLAHAALERVPLTGLSDHFVSEAVYLRDPDHHGIEIYWDRPRETWEGRVGERLTTMPLDTDSLLAELPDPQQHGFSGLPAGTVMGHVHLRVAEVPAAIEFYCGLLGFGLMVSIGSAAFMSAGGYHHHIGANVWESAGAPAAPADRARLLRMTIVLPDASARDDLVGRCIAAGASPEEDGDAMVIRDPSGNVLALAVAGPAAPA